MALFTTLDEIPQLDKPCGLTIGTFDGVHLGHQSLLTHLRKQIPEGGILTVFTFSNHPSHLFSPHSPTPLICPALQKVKHLYEWGADHVIMVPFDLDFAQIPFDQFLSLMKQRLGFSWLILGEGAAFGKGKRGDRTAVKQLSSILHFQVEYLRKISLHHHSISSGRIRTLIQQGEFTQVSDCLGRPYSLIGHPIEKNGRVFCPFPGVCLPPEGDYEVKLPSPGIASVSHQDQGVYLKSKPLHDKEITIEF